MSTPLTPSQAKVWTLSAQAGALVCVLGAVAIGVLGLPDHAPGAAIEQAKANAWPINTPGADSGTPGNTSKPINSRAVDTLGVAERFALMDNAPVIIERNPEPTNPEPPVVTGPTIDEATIVRRVKYIGFINDARTQHAFIRIDGKQRIVSAGGIAKSGDEQFSDLAVERITPQLIILRDGETRAAVNIAEKSGSSITMVSGDDIPVAVVPGQDEPLLTAEEEAMIESLPPRQRQMARRRLEREKRGLPPENENRRPTPEPLVSTRGTFNRNGETPDVRRRDNDRND
jgi:hypothetical protein